MFYPENCILSIKILGLVYLTISFAFTEPNCFVPSIIDRMLVSPQHSHVEAPISSVATFEDETSEEAARVTVGFQKSDPTQ